MELDVFIDKRHEESPNCVVEENDGGEDYHAETGNEGKHGW